jgi:TPR repeat protein
MIRVTRWAVVLVLGLLVPLAGHAGADDIRRDALQGSTAAQYEMGILYEFGFHLAEHEIEALAWYSVAAERGNQPAARRRDLLNARLSSAQRAQAEQRSREIMAGMPAAVPVEPVMPAPEAAPAPQVEAAPEAAPPTASEPPASPEALPVPPPAEPAPKP